LSQRILVVRLSSLGDVVLTGPVYKNLKAHWPDCRISVLVKPQYAAVLEGHPGIDEIIAFRGLWSAVQAIRERSFTHCLDLHATLRSWLLRRCSGIPEQVVYRKDSLARRLYVAFGLPSPSLQRHTVDRYLEALSGWGVPASVRAPSPSDWGAPTASAAARRVVVLQTSFLGDSLLTLPLLRRIKESLPGSLLAVVTLPKHAEVFRNTPWVDELICDDKKGAHGGLLGPWKIAAEIRKGRFDLAVIPHRSLRSALVAYLARVPRRVGFSASAGSFLLTDVVPFSWLTHDLERNLALARPLGGESSPRSGEERYILPSPPGPRLARLLAESGIRPEDRLVGVHPGAVWATKRWDRGRFAQLCRKFIEEGLRPVIVGGPSDERLGAEIAQASGAADLTGKTDLEDLKSLMGRLSLLLTNDSGPMHLAAAAGVPVVAVFGATTRELGFFPYGAAHRVVEVELACRPCGLHGARACPQGHFLCMRLITTDLVLSACRQALRAGIEA